MAEIDEALKEMQLDLNTLTMLMILVLAIGQALRGQVMVSSASLLWFAYTIATRARDKEVMTAGKE
jgi:hypothetical protein